MPRFNPAPGWPAAPEGWTPPAGWQPDPSWPAAPAGWQVMVDDVPAYGHVAPQPSAPVVEEPAGERALLEFTSHIAGKNAKVRVYQDRIEWERKSMNAGVRHGMAAMTVGLSYAATGIVGKRDTEVIPMRSVSSVTTKKGMMNTLVRIITSGNTLEMNVSHVEAQQVRDTVNNIIAGGGKTAAAPTVHVQMSAAPSAPAPAQPGPDMAQLVAWHREGILSDEEFSAAKRKALGL